MQLEDMLREAQLHPIARRRCNDGEAPASADLERQLSSVTQELQVRLRFALLSNMPGLASTAKEVTSEMARISASPCGGRHCQYGSETRC